MHVRVCNAHCSSVVTREVRYLQGGPKSEALTTSEQFYNVPRFGGAVFITPGGRSVDSTQ